MSRTIVNIILVFLVASLGFMALLGVTLIPEVFGNMTNGTVKTYVNVTNTEPHIYRMEINPSPITLSPGNRTKITCTAYVFDWNGWRDVANGYKNATFYDINYNWNSPDDNNYHYSNLTCQNCTEITDPDGTNASCNCSFDIEYYANDTTWLCNFTVADNGGAYSNRKNLTNWSTINVTVEPLIAINVPQTIDYGELAVTENSSMIPANLTNFGNININVSVEGWGGDNETQGENLSMICRRPDGNNIANITVGFEKYSVNPWTNYTDMLNLSSQETQIQNFTLPQRLNDTYYGFGHDRNATYWRIYIPPGVTGFCNGTVRFTARPVQDEPV
jgi:hypothetical protein